VLATERLEQAVPDVLKGGPTANRVAAATGIGFVALALAVFVLQEWYNFANVGQFALLASNEVWGSYVFLTGVAAVLLFWFVSTASERMRQIEESAGGSGRLARAFFAAGSVVAGLLVVAVGVQFAARQVSDVEIAALAASFIEGPTLFFPIAVLVGSAGLIALRAGGMVPSYSQLIGWVALVGAPFYVLLAGLQIYFNYAWIDETGYLVFLAFVLALSVIGVQRWGELDTGFTPEAAGEGAPGVVAPTSEEPKAVELPAKKSPPKRKASTPKTTARKPAARKPAKRKPAAKGGAARKPAKRKPASGRR
jgi:hypothetical protein